MKHIAAAFVILIGAAMVMVSDLAIRAQGLDGTNGLDAGSWDLAGTVVVCIGAVVFVRNAWRN